MGGLSGCFFSCCWVIASRGRDVRPAAHSLSFASPKESKQRKGDPTVRVPPLRYGQPAMLGRRVLPQNSLRAARSVQTCCGKSEHEVRVSFGTRTHPPPCASRHAQKGWGKPPGHRCARPGLGRALRTAGAAARSARAPGRAQRWPVCGSPPLLAAPVAGCLRGAHGRLRAHASCSDSPRLSERSAQRAVSSAAAPRKCPDAGLPRSESVGGADWGSPFLCLLSFGEAKESECAVGRTSRTPGSNRPAKVKAASKSSNR